VTAQLLFTDARATALSITAVGARRDARADLVPEGASDPVRFRRSSLSHGAGFPRSTRSTRAGVKSPSATVPAEGD
jgi:hypothetical protein